MAENEGSTMSAEERLATAWVLFQRVKRQSERIDAQIRAVRLLLEEGAKDEDHGRVLIDPLSLTETAAEMAEDWSYVWDLEKILRPEGVAA